MAPFCHAETSAVKSCAVIGMGKAGARELNYDVPQQAMAQAVNNLQNSIGYGVDIECRGTEVASGRPSTDRISTLVLALGMGLLAQSALTWVARRAALVLAERLASAARPHVATEPTPALEAERLERLYREVASG